MSEDRLAQRLTAARQGRVDDGRDRRRRVLEPLPGLRVRAAGRVLHNFSSNDYLGLTGAADPATGHPSGSGASALVTGYQPIHRELEAALARLLGREAVLLCGSGYLANLAVATALAGRGDTIVQDRLCHASLIDAARLSGADLRRYAHADPEAADRRLAKGRGLSLLVTDGVFSMDGDAAPLEALAPLARQHGATLVVDDAHGIGVLGAGGGGLCEALRLGEDAVPVLVGTLGKAFGAAGAFVAGSQALIEHLENHGRSVIYTTALPPVVAASALAAVEQVRSDDAPRRRLAAHVARFRAGAAERGVDLLPSDTPIQPLVVGEERRALALQAALEERGYLVAAIRPPTVPVGTSRLRITLSAGHDEAQLTGLLDALAESLTRLGPTPAPGDDPS